MQGSRSGCQACSIHVEEHIVCTGELSENFDLGRLIDGPRFSRLSNGDNFGLNVMLVANSVICGPHCFNCKFALGCREGNKLAACEPFGGAAFVSMNVRDIA